MIKKYLLGLFVGFVSFIGFGYAFPDLVQVTPGSTYNGDISNVENFYLGEDLSFSVPVKYSNFNGDYQSAFYWDVNGYLHYFVLNQYGRSDYIINSYTLVVSGSSDTTLSQSQFIDYVSNHLGDVYKVEFYFGYTCQASYNYGTTFSIHFNNGNYIYFAGGLCEGNNLYVTPGGGPKQSPTSGTLAGLQSYNSPFLYSGNGSVNYTSCPTVGQLIANYNYEGFSEGLCYTTDTIFNGSTFEHIEKKSIFDLYSGSADYINDLTKFGQYCESSVYNQSVCYEAFSGQFYNLNLLSKIPKDLGSLGGSKSLYKYCDLYNYPTNATTCVASGVLLEYGTEFSRNDVVNSLQNGQYTIVGTDSGSVYGALSGSSFSGDVITNIQHFFSKFTSLFKKQTGNVVGFLPDYIIFALLGIILFKLFRK